MPMGSNELKDDAQKEKYCHVYLGVLKAVWRNNNEIQAIVAGNFGLGMTARMQ